jgi:predicted dehydrogenase
MPVSWFPDVRVPALRGGPVLRWGVLAPGGIAGDFTETVLANTDQRVTAVASRSIERAARFAARHGIDRVSESYEQLVADPEVDVVYVAAPHSEHRALSLLAISAGKHVLIEKPIAVSATEAEEIAAAARSAGVLAAEAMWTRYLPQFDVLHQVLERGDLGVVRLATADVGWRLGPDAPARFFDPAQGGGAALDMGVYGYWFAQFAIGRPVRIRALGGMTGSGVDDQAVVALAWQASALAHFAAEGMRDSPVHSLDDAISVMRTIDAVRRQLQEAQRASPGEEMTPGAEGTA